MLGVRPPPGGPEPEVPVNAIRCSFEFFPPKTDAGQAKLVEAARALAAAEPEFYSVTYGAGGSTRDRTIGAVLDVASATGRPTAPHLSCVGQTRESIRELLALYRGHGIDRIVALRGDLPSGMGGVSGPLRYANELVAFIRAETGSHFHIEVAAYPEMHPEARSFQHDVEAFVRKVRAGASSAITQFFYAPDAYFAFVDRVAALGCDIPIVPGIMPITNHTKLARFAESCGAEIPRWILKGLEQYGDDEKSIAAFGEHVVTKLCERLLAGGAPSLHFYTLNQAGPSLAIYRNLVRA